MNNDTEPLAAIPTANRYRDEELEELGIKEIHESDIVTALPSFDQAFKSALLGADTGRTYGLTKLERVLFSVDK